MSHKNLTRDWLWAMLSIITKFHQKKTIRKLNKWQWKRCHRYTYMTSMNGINSLKIRRAAIRNGCKIRADISNMQYCTKTNNRAEKRNIRFPYAENCDKTIDRRNLEACNTCKIASSKECDIEENHLDRGEKIAFTSFGAISSFSRHVRQG